MSKRSTLVLSALATVAFAAPAFAQTYTRDHRTPQAKPPVVRDHRAPQKPTPIVRGRRQPVQPLPTVLSYAPLTGPAGTTVTVVGRNFEAGTYVTYDGKLLAPSLITNRKLEFAIPAGASDGVISIRGPSARAATTVGAFDVVTPKPAPTWGVNVNANASWRVRFDSSERERVQSRRGRRANRAKQYQQRWRRAFLRDTKTQAELTLHARRIAKLERMKRIATARDNARLARRIDIAIKRENLRHDRKMTQLEQAFFA